MVDAAGKIMAVNPFGAEQLGYRVDELLGQPVLKVFYGADREAVKPILPSAWNNSGGVVSWEFRSVRKNGDSASGSRIGQSGGASQRSHPFDRL